MRRSTGGRRELKGTMIESFCRAATSRQTDERRIKEPLISCPPGGDVSPYSGKRR